MRCPGDPGESDVLPAIRERANHSITKRLPQRIQSSSAPLRIGIAGCGEIGLAVHIPLLRRMSGVTITALADENEDSLGRAARLCPEAARFSDYATMIDTAGLDALLVALPGHLHAAAAIASFKAGLHVYLEKPAASALADGADAVHAWRASGKTGMIGFNYRFNPLYAKLRQRLREGLIGRPIVARTSFCTWGSLASGWRTGRATGGGALLELGSHHADLARFLFGAEVQAVAATVHTRRTEDDTAQLRMDLDNGISVDTFVTLAGPVEERIEIVGEHGKLWVDRTSSFDVGYSSATASRMDRITSMLRAAPTPSKVAHLRAKLTSPCHEPSYRSALEAFIHAASTGATVSPDIADGYASLSIVTTAELSAQSGRTVQVAENVHRSLAP